jgi:vacuolar-type H+-ATPase subunit H
LPDVHLGADSRIVNAELESILAADEEARARVKFAEARRRREVEAARAECDRLLREREDAMQAELAAEISRIRETGEQELAAARRSHEQFLSALQRTGEQELERAARLWAHIVAYGETP